jgi:hypothetical protein
MTDFEREPGAIDDPGGPGGQDVDVSRLPPGDTADDTGGPAQPEVAELDLPGPDDPVAWNYVEPGTRVLGPDGEKIGTVEAMLGTDVEGIFHGVAVKPESGGPARVIPSDDVGRLTPSSITVKVTADQLAELPEQDSPGR